MNLHKCLCDLQKQKLIMSVCIVSINKTQLGTYYLFIAFKRNLYIQKVYKHAVNNNSQKVIYKEGLLFILSYVHLK